MTANESEQVERIKIDTLFQLYFKYAGCSELTTTKPDSFIHFDFRMNSGDTEIIGEFKNRPFKINKYNDTFIEFAKYKFLIDVIQFSGKSAMYVNEYEDYILVYNLNKFFEREKYLERDYCFVNQSMPVDNSGGSSQRMKSIRYLKFHEASIILDKRTYKAIDHKTLVINLMNEYNEQ